MYLCILQYLLQLKSLENSMSNTAENREWETLSEDLENDESPSDPIEISLPPSHDGQYSAAVEFCRTSAA